MLCYSYALSVHFQSTGHYAFSCRKVDVCLQCVNDLSVREGESGADESGQMWTLKNGRTVLYPALTGIQTHGSNIAISILDQLCWIG